MRGITPRCEFTACNMSLPRRLSCRSTGRNQLKNMCSSWSCVIAAALPPIHVALHDMTWIKLLFFQQTATELQCHPDWATNPIAGGKAHKYSNASILHLPIL